MENFRVGKIRISDDRSRHGDLITICIHRVLVLQLSRFHKDHSVHPKHFIVPKNELAV